MIVFVLYNRARKCEQMDNGGDNSCLHGIAFAELVAFMEEMKGGAINHQTKGHVLPDLKSHSQGGRHFLALIEILDQLL